MNKTRIKQINETKAKIKALKEQKTMVGLASLMESELDKATLVLSIKGISDDLQQMAEKLAKMEADEIMPILDPLKAAFGPEMANAFNTAATEQLRGLVEAIKTAKDSIGDQILRLEGIANGEPVNDMSFADDAAPVTDPAVDGALDASVTDDAETDMSGMDSTDMDDDTESFDDFGDDTLQDPAAGRARKESAEFRHASNPDKFVFEAVVSRIKRGIPGKKAATMVAENLGLEYSDVAEIVSEMTLRKKRA